MSTPSPGASRGRWSHIPPAAWVGGIVLAAVLIVPILYLRTPLGAGLETDNPWLYRHRRLLTIVYVAVVFLVCSAASTFFSARHRRLHGSK